ncbi:MAG: hypothetical protein ACHQIL_02335 [Steroidobacterales bacterium]
MNPGTIGNRRYRRAAAAFCLLALAAAAASAAEPPSAAVWKERKDSISYFGLTSTYSCMGIEGRIKQILAFLGARKDVSVNASACNSHDMPIGHSMIINVHFYSLAAPEPTSAAPHVMAGWAPLEIKPRSPTFMQDGDCELVDQMHEFIQHNFSSRNLEYRAQCTPYATTMDSYAVHGEFLQIAKQ